MYNNRYKLLEHENVFADSIRILTRSEQVFNFQYNPNGNLITFTAERAIMQLSSITLTLTTSVELF